MIKFLLECIAIVVLVKIFLFVWDAAPRVFQDGQGTLTISINSPR